MENKKNPIQRFGPRIAIERRKRYVRRTARNAVERYRIDCRVPPRNCWYEVIGPGVGLRLIREGSHDFFSIAEIVKTLVRPGMSDLEKALAVYRFSQGHAHGFGVGFGGFEATRFLNCFGYSFCWGQADFQHLLYEAAGLRVRAPQLKGHSSVEVLIDGKWRMMDAFMRLIAPSIELDGLATGAELHAHPEIWGHIREGSVVASARKFWSVHGSGATYEPWQDSRAMLLNLRRGETLRFGYDRREAWCAAPAEPPDYCNAEWSWMPILDGIHLREECDVVENIGVQAGTLTSRDPLHPARLEYSIRSPYPLCAGSFSAVISGDSMLRISISNDRRKSWVRLPERRTDRIACDLTSCLSRKRLQGEEVASVPDHLAVFEIVVRLEWSGSVSIRDPRFRLLVQAHNPSLPRLESGLNRWTLLSTDRGAGVGHAWNEYPGLTVSNPSPLEGENVVIGAVIHNRGSAPARNVAVRFRQAGTGVALGRVVISRIAPRSSAEARIVWRAGIRGDRPPRSAGALKPYVRTVVRVETGPDLPTGPWTGVAEAILIVRPRPRPKFNGHLIWASNGRHLNENKLILRAALVHLPQEQGCLYQRQALLAATFTPFLGHPEHGGIRLAAPRRVADIPATEFGVAEWTLATHDLPRAFYIWVLVECDESVLPECRRLLARRRVELFER